MLRRMLCLKVFIQFPRNCSRFFYPISRTLLRRMQSSFTSCGLKEKAASTFVERFVMSFSLSLSISLLYAKQYTGRKKDTTAGCVVGTNISHDKSSLLPSHSQSCSGGDGSGSARPITGDCCQSKTSCLMNVTGNQLSWLWLWVQQLQEIVAKVRLSRAIKLLPKEDCLSGGCHWQSVNQCDLLKIFALYSYSLSYGYHWQSLNYCDLWKSFNGPLNCSIKQPNIQVGKIDEKEALARYHEPSSASDF